MLKGIATSSGIAIGKVYKLEQPNVVVNTGAGVPEKELEVFTKALEKTISGKAKIIRDFGEDKIYQS